METKSLFAGRKEAVREMGKNLAKTAEGARGWLSLSQPGPCCRGGTDGDSHPQGAAAVRRLGKGAFYHPGLQSWQNRAHGGTTTTPRGPRGLATDPSAVVKMDWSLQGLPCILGDT